MRGYPRLKRCGYECNILQKGEYEKICLRVTRDVDTVYEICTKWHIAPRGRLKSAADVHIEKSLWCLALS